MRSCISCSCSFSILHSIRDALTVARSFSGPHAARDALLFAGDPLVLFFGYLPQLFACFRARIAKFIRSLHDNLAIYTSKKKTVASNCFGDGSLGTEWRTTVQGPNAVMSAFGSIAADLDSMPSPTPSQMLLVSMVDRSSCISSTLLMERL